MWLPAPWGGWFSHWWCAAWRRSDPSTIKPTLPAPPLTDVGHRSMEGWNWFPGDDWKHPWFHDVYCHFLLAAFIVVTGATRGWFPGMDVRGLIYEWCIPHGCLLLMKASLMVVTTVPTPLSSCRTTGVQTGQMTHFCNDLMFSGHSVLMVMVPFFYQQCPYAAWWGKAGFWVGGAFGLVLILGTHQHYTSDVLVAVYMTLALLMPRRKGIALHWGGAQSCTVENFGLKTS
eukprot:TRINITY_DN14237_c0_g1_i2.p1 TRINITY_DN14237_c0_g1~~TRINITY_DN14237_c0_g1_i2.p1  ORF type:complete len:230 (-),score=19.84 TRINITY_DN14237_c0_g1_i2:299-988(-)